MADLSSIKLTTNDKILAALILLVLIVGGYIALPLLVQLTGWLVALAENTLFLLVEIAVAVFVLMNLGNIFYGFMSMTQAIRKFIIRVNPVATLDTAIEQIHKKQDSISAALAESKASQTRMSLRIRNPRFRGMSAMDEDSLNQAGALDKAEREESLALEAKKKTRPDTEIAQHMVAAERYRQQAAAFQPRLEQLLRMQGMLGQAKELADSKIADMQNQRDILVTSLDAEKDGAKAVGLFKRVLGRSPELTMAQLSVDEILKQTTEAEAEIDQFLEAIQPQLADQDLKKGAQVDAAMARFSTFTGQKALTPGPMVAGTSPIPVKDGVVVEKQVH